MAEVWVLEVGCYSDRYVAAVFSSREEAHRQLRNRGLVRLPEEDDADEEEEAWGPHDKKYDWMDAHSLSRTQLDDFWREEGVEVTLRQKADLPEGRGLHHMPAMDADDIEFQPLSQGRIKMEDWGQC